MTIELIRLNIKLENVFLTRQDRPSKEVRIRLTFKVKLPKARSQAFPARTIRLTPSTP